MHIYEKDINHLYRGYVVKYVFPEVVYVSHGFN